MDDLQWPILVKAVGTIVVVLEHKWRKHGSIDKALTVLRVLSYFFTECVAVESYLIYYLIIFFVFAKDSSRYTVD